MQNYHGMDTQLKRAIGAQFKPSLVSGAKLGIGYEQAG